MSYCPCAAADRFTISGSARSLSSRCFSSMFGMYSACDAVTPGVADLPLRHVADLLVEFRLLGVRRVDAGLQHALQQLGQQLFGRRAGLRRHRDMMHAVQPGGRQHHPRQRRRRDHQPGVLPGGDQLHRSFRLQGPRQIAARCVDVALRLVQRPAPP